MRLRNIPRAEGVLADCEQVIKNETLHRGSWHTFLRNDNPLHIEIGMGKGQFLLQLAREHPEINYIGIERYSSVLLRAIEKYRSIEPSEAAPSNVHFICMDARQLTSVFASNEVARIYLNFSDPWPKARHARRRLTSSDYFALYDQILTEDGIVEFKTDNRALFDFSVEELKASKTFEMAACTYDLHHDETMNQDNIMTEYEEKFSSQGNPICKLIARHQKP